MNFDEITPEATERRLRVVMAATLVALAVGAAARLLFGPVGSTVVVVLFVCALVCYQFPVMYPRRWWKFFFRLPTRSAYRRAGTRDWTVAADLHRHGVTPEHVTALCAAHQGHPRNIAHEVGWLLNHAQHPDGPLAATLAAASDRFDIGGSLGPLLDVPAEQRTDALAFHAIEGTTLYDVTILCRSRLPYGIAARAIEHGGADARKAVLKIAQVWSSDEVASALAVDRGSETGRARLAEHLHEWIDAQPALATAAVGTPAQAAALIASYGTVPLAGWWHAAGYDPQEAREIAGRQDWSLGQLRALAALRLGPPVDQGADTH